MHPEAYRFIAQHIGTPASVLEVGSLNINGSPRALAPTATWWGIDRQAGRDVDEVCDAETWTSPNRFDLAICAEVFEHTGYVTRILRMIASHLQPGGRLLVTCATHGRDPHSAIDGGPVRNDEFYRNVDPVTFLTDLEVIGYEPIHFETHHDRGDLYLLAVLPNG